MKQLIIGKNRMFVQVLIEKKKKKKRKECSSQEIYMALFFLSCTHERCKIVEGNEEKSCCKPIAPTYLANKKMSTTDRTRKRQVPKNDRKTTITAEIIARG
jgi:hypothetical protein